jgi:chemotaxis protein MotB
MQKPSTLKPKYLEAERGGQRERWLVSYSDFITILLILFAAIASQGLHSAQTPAPPSPKPPKQAVSKPRPEARPQPQDPALVQALTQNEAKLRALGLDSHLEKRGLVISLPQAILFPSGEDRVLPAALPIVSEVAGVLASLPNKVALVGHADSLPIHTKRFRSNWELSAARGMNLLELLSARYGIDESRLSVQSFGSNDPKNSNDTAAGRAENRRVEILLLDESAP